MASSPSSTPSADGDKLDRALLLVACVVVLGAIMSILDMTVVNVAINTLARDFDDHAADDPVGVDRLHARARDGDPAHRLGRRPLRHQAPVHALDRAVRRRLGALRAAWQPRSLIALPRPAGPRRRHADAARHDDPDPRRRPAADRPRDGHHRRADAARPDLRPDPRRLAGRRRLLALDLLHQPADRRGALLLSRRVLPRDVPQPAQPLDWLGLALLSPGLALLIYGLAESSSEGGFGHAKVLRPDARRRVALACFVRHALRDRGDALIDLRLFKNRDVRGRRR